MVQRPPDLEKLRQKLEFIRRALRQLESIRDEGREAFLPNPIYQAAATRNLQVAIEAMIDAAGHIVAREALGIPKTYQDSLDLLFEAGVLPKEKTSAFRTMVKFRNRVVHLYDEVEPERIFQILEEDLGDFEVFVKSILRRYFQ